MESRDVQYLKDKKEIRIDAAESEYIPAYLKYLKEYILQRFGIEDENNIKWIFTRNQK